MLWLPELRIRIQLAEPFIWQLVGVDPIREFPPAQAVITLHPVLIWALPVDMDREKFPEKVKSQHSYTHTCVEYMMSGTTKLVIY